MIPCHLAFFHNFVCCGASGDIELAVAVCYLVNLVCPSLGECFAYNFSTTHGSEHTCPSKGSSTSPFADCLCQNITQNSVLRKEKKGSDIDAQRDASCTRNAARLQHLYASDPALSVPRAPVDTKWLRTGLGAPTPQCRPLTAAYGRFFWWSLSALAESHTAPERQPQKQLLSLLRTTTRLRWCQLVGDRSAHNIWKTMSAGHAATEAHRILFLSCSAIAACSGGGKPA